MMSRTPLTHGSSGTPTSSTAKCLNRVHNGKENQKWKTGVVSFNDIPRNNWAPSWKNGLPPLTLGPEVQLCWLLPLTLEPSAQCTISPQWRIWGGRKGRAPPPLDQNFFIFMQFSRQIGQIIGWCPLHPLWVWRTSLWEILDPPLPLLPSSLQKSFQLKYEKLLINFLVNVTQLINSHIFSNVYNNYSIIAGSLGSAYWLLWAPQRIWRQGGGTFGSFMIMRPNLSWSHWFGFIYMRTLSWCHFTTSRDSTWTMHMTSFFYF